MKRLILLLTLFFSFGINQSFSDLEFTGLPTTQTCGTISGLSSMSGPNFVFDDSGLIMYFSIQTGYQGNTFNIYKISVNSPFDCSSYNGTYTLISSTGIGTRYSSSNGFQFYQGNLYIYDGYNKKIHKYDVLNNTFSTIYTSSYLSTHYTFDHLNGIFLTQTSISPVFTFIQITNGGTNVINNITSILPFKLNSGFSYDNIYYNVTNTNNCTITGYELVNNQFSSIGDFVIGGSCLNYSFGGNIKFNNNFLYNPTGTFPGSITKLPINLTNSNLSCVTKPVNYPYNFSYKPDEFSINNYYYENDNQGFFEYANMNTGSDLYSIRVGNLENLTNFTGSLLDPNIPFTFDSLDLSLKDPYIRLNAGNRSINYLTLSGSIDTYLNGVNTDGFYIFDCLNSNSDSDEWLDFGVQYNFEGINELCIGFNKTTFADINIYDIDFGSREVQFLDTEICRNDNGEIFVDGDPFSGDINNIGSELPNVVIGKNYDLLSDDLDRLDKPINQSGSLFDYLKNNPGNDLYIGNYGNIVYDNIDKRTCKMFDDTGNFLYSVNTLFNVNIDLGYFITNEYLKDVISPANKLLDGFEKPINNFLNLLGSFGQLENGKNYCVFGIVEKYEGQKYLINNGSAIGPLQGYEIEVGEKTFIDYFFLFIYGMLYISVFFVLVLNKSE